MTIYYMAVRLKPVDGTTVIDPQCPDEPIVLAQGLPGLVGVLLVFDNPETAAQWGGGEVRPVILLESQGGMPA